MSRYKILLVRTNLKSLVKSLSEKIHFLIPSMIFADRNSEFSSLTYIYWSMIGLNDCTVCVYNDKNLFDRIDNVTPLYCQMYELISCFFVNNSKVVHKSARKISVK